MTQPHNAPRSDADRDIARVSQEIAGRLLARGVAVHDSDSPDDLVRLLEAVEAFERAVESRGGDLMMDEPPPRKAGEPDDPHFRLPTRAADESASAYLERLAATTAAVRKHKPHS
jgi:hypothetical protein